MKTIGAGVATWLASAGICFGLGDITPKVKAKRALAKSLKKIVAFVQDPQQLATFFAENPETLKRLLTEYLPNKLRDREIEINKAIETLSGQQNEIIAKFNAVVSTQQLSAIDRARLEIEQIEARRQIDEVLNDLREKSLYPIQKKLARLPIFLDVISHGQQLKANAQTLAGLYAALTDGKRSAEDVTLLAAAVRTDIEWMITEF